jgi:hypothetical protein
MPFCGTPRLPEKYLIDHRQVWANPLSSLRRDATAILEQKSVHLYSRAHLRQVLRSISYLQPENQKNFIHAGKCRQYLADRAE